MSSDLNLKINIRGDSKGAEDSVSRVNTALRGLQDASTKLNGLIGGLGVGLSLAGVGSFIKSGIDAADALNDMSDRTGIAIEKLAGFQLATKLADTDMQSFATAANKLSVNIGKNSEQFAKLGITAKDPADAFLQLAEVFSSIEDPQTRAAFGAAALGKSYAEMAPLLQMGSDKIRELVEQGIQQSGITKEQAAEAGKFNDQLDILSQRASYAAMSLSGPLVEGLNAVGEAFFFAKNQANALNPADYLEAFAAGGSTVAKIDYFEKKIAELPQKIEQQKGKIDRLTAKTGLAKLDASLLGYNVDEEKQKLDALLTQETLFKSRLDKLKGVKPEPATSNAPATNDVKNFIGKSEDQKQAEEALKKQASLAKAAADAEKNRVKSINDVVAGLQLDISVSTLSEEQQKRALELSRALEKARGDEVGVITELVNKKYNDIEASKRQQAQWDQLIADANKYADLRKEIDDLSKTDLTLNSFGGGIAKIQDQLKEGIISPDQAKQQFDKLGSAFNDSFVDPASNGIDSLSVFAEQGARNIQSSFADFLFDPFNQGLDGLAAGFAKTIQRMVAEAASAQILGSLFGDSNGKISLTSGIAGSAIKELGSSAWSGLSGLFAGVFHEGGVVGEGGRGGHYSPALFVNAPRYHNGGTIGLKPDEVPAILQRGERVLTKGQQSAMLSSSDVQISTSVTVNGGSGNNSAAIGDSINQKIKEWVMTEKRPGGMLA